jgi:arylsulfatase A-like enzyme
MQFVDELLGEYMGRLPSDATLVVVSDHGFDFWGCEHDNSPAGVLIVRGPAIQSGVFDNASLYDVAPTLLHVLGLPVADDMEGAPLPIARSGGELDREPTRVASHGRPSRPLAAERPNAESLEKHEEYLRALGYVN